MAEDPIVSETRKLREEMFQEAGGSLDGLFELLKEEQKRYSDKLVRLPSRKATVVATREGEAR